MALLCQLERDSTPVGERDGPGGRLGRGLMTQGGTGLPG